MAFKDLATMAAFKNLKPHGPMVEVKGENLEALKKVLFDSLKDILEICEEENIEVTMSGGSCLGTVRHQGFIPWDDDIDLNMTREGYKKFFPAFEKRFGDKYWVLDAQRTKDYPVICPQVRRKGTTVRLRDDFHNMCGACIDLCIIENIPNNVLLRNLHGLISLFLGLTASCRRFYQKKDSYLALAQGNDNLIRTVNNKARIGSLFFFASYGKLYAAWDRWNSICRNSNSKYVSIPGGRKHYFGEIQPRNVFFPVAKGNFEGIEVPLPANSDAYLTSLYGPDYMTPPSKDNQETHVVLEFDLGEYAPQKQTETK